MSFASLSDVVSQRDDDWASVQRITLGCPEPCSKTLYWFSGASTTQADDLGWESYWCVCKKKNAFGNVFPRWNNVKVISKLHQLWYTKFFHLFGVKDVYFFLGNIYIYFVLVTFLFFFFSEVAHAPRFLQDRATLYILI